MKVNLCLLSLIFTVILVLLNASCNAETTGVCLDATCGSFVSTKDIDSYHSVSLSACTENDYSYTFGECDSVTNLRAAVPFWRPPALCDPNGTVLPSVKYIPCDASCPEGQIYDVESGSCSACPAGTVASDSTRMYNVWHGSLPAQMRSTCVQKSANKPCNPWTLHDSFIDSGDNSHANNFESVLEFSFTLQTEGSLEVRHRISSEPRYDTGSIIVDSVVVVKESGASEWETSTIPLSSGPHVVSFVYATDLATSSGDDKFYIEYIKVTGLAPVALKCSKCDPGFSQSSDGQIACRMCLPGSYSDKSGSPSCAECPLGYHSYAGASSCFRSRECSEEDMSYSLSECDPTTLTQTKSYFWISPAACVVGSKSLPDDEEISCSISTTCNPGMYLHDGKCDFCHDDEKSENGVECDACPSGRTPVMKARYFNTWDNLPEGFTTRCQGQCSTNGWRPAHAFIDSGSSLGIGSSSLSWVVSTEKGAQLKYSVEPRCEPGMNFSFYDNGVLKADIPCGGCSAQLTEMEYVFEDKGSHLVKWVVSGVVSVQQASACSSVRIHSISLAGITDIIGGATSCSECGAGYIVNTETNACSPCPAGSFSAPGDTACRPCLENSVSHEHSAACFACGNGTKPNSNQDSCEISCESLTTTWVKSFSTDVFNLTFLGDENIQFNPDDDELTINLCGKAKCFGDSYYSFVCGQITDPHTKDTVFLSGDLLTFVNIPQYSRNGVVARVDSSEDGVCVISLMLLCDPTLDDTAAPVLEDPILEGCKINVVIRSPYACRTCDEHDIKVTNSTCYNGKLNRTITVNTDMCVGVEDSVEELDCQNQVTMLTSLIIGVSVGSAIVLIAIIALIIALVVRNRRIYGKYQKLIVAAETGDAFNTANDDDE